MIRTIVKELEHHAPFTALGAVLGVVFIGLVIWTGLFSQVTQNSVTVFYIAHPLHVFLSAIVTTAIYRRHRRSRRVITAICIGYLGSISIATLSDSIIPFWGEWLLNLPNRGIHIGFLEEPWFIHPAALAGIAIGFLKPRTTIPHSGHLLVSTWASLFHIIMALGSSFSLYQMAAIVIFLFLAVWMPCCLSDIVFPLFFVPEASKKKDST